jgi:hypothetical protein
MSIRRACSAVVAGACLLAVPLFAGAVETAGDAFGTAAYQKNVRSLAMMNKLDANGDHAVSRAEFDAYYGKLFDTLDRDHDGTLDRNEWVGAAKNRAAVSLSDGGYVRALASMDMMTMLDTDSDHTVSRAEFLHAHEAMFDRIAAGGTGPVDASHWLATYFPK